MVLTSSPTVSFVLSQKCAVISTKRNLTYLNIPAPGHPKLLKFQFPLQVAQSKKEHNFGAYVAQANEPERRRRHTPVTCPLLHSIPIICHMIDRIVHHSLTHSFICSQSSTNVESIDTSAERKVLLIQA